MAADPILRAVRRLVLVVLGITAFAAGAVTAAAWLYAEPAADAVRELPRATAERVREAPERAVRKAKGDTVPLARCPADAGPGCRAVRGRVVLVESVDPDGDGDLHVVVTGGSITGPGVTAIDVSPALRPERDPRIGDVVTAAGPVQRGSYGQDQIHALRFRAAR
jgi:hypothetical protein